jgi:hypothetical protein
LKLTRLNAQFSNRARTGPRAVLHSLKLRKLLTTLIYKEVRSKLEKHLQNQSTVYRITNAKKPFNISTDITIKKIKITTNIAILTFNRSILEVVFMLMVGPFLAEL